MIDHEYFIRQTLKLARKGIGKTATNPLVGAVLVKVENGEAVLSPKATTRVTANRTRKWKPFAARNAKGSPIFPIQSCMLI